MGSCKPKTEYALPWEIYGHWEESWNTDSSKIRTDVVYLLDAPVIGQRGFTIKRFPPKAFGLAAANNDELASFYRNLQALVIHTRHIDLEEVFVLGRGNISSRSDITAVAFNVRAHR